MVIAILLDKTMDGNQLSILRKLCDAIIAFFAPKRLTNSHFNISFSWNKYVGRVLIVMRNYVWRRM